MPYLFLLRGNLKLTKDVCSSIDGELYNRENRKKELNSLGAVEVNLWGIGMGVEHESVIGRDLKSSYIDRKRVAVVMVAFMVLVSVGVTYSIISQYQGGEWRFPEGQVWGIAVTLDLIRDAEITMGFQNDPGLIMRLDYTLDPDNTVDFHVETRSNLQGIIGFDIGSYSTEHVKMSTVSIVLGSTAEYYLTLRVAYSNITLTYSNNATIDGDEVYMYASHSNLNLTITEDIAFDDGTLEINTAFLDDVNLVVDLPDGLSGEINLGTGSYYVAENQGWWSIPGGYRTGSLDPPIVEIELGFSGYATLRLRN
ncbi:MAG: hypothetical protein ACW968_06255 [Candidatus Thorarchaeota archaeon]|jgi:hypothetical protein